MIICIGILGCSYYSIYYPVNREYAESKGYFAKDFECANIKVHGHNHDYGLFMVFLQIHNNCNDTVKFSANRAEIFPNIAGSEVEIRSNGKITKQRDFKIDPHKVGKFVLTTRVSEIEDKVWVDSIRVFLGEITNTGNDSITGLDTLNFVPIPDQ